MFCYCVWHRRRAPDCCFAVPLLCCAAAAAQANVGKSDFFLSCLQASDGELLWTRQVGTSKQFVFNFWFVDSFTSG
jgi:outer membrane protein assembly factor BamB